MDKSELLQYIEQEDLLDFVEDRGEEVEVFDAEHSKTVVFRISPFTTETLAQRICFGVSLCSGSECAWAAQIAAVLLHLDSAVTSTLRYILVVGSIDDAEQMATELSLDAEEIPCALYGARAHSLNDDCLGVTWFSESSVIINVRAIKRAALEMARTEPLSEGEVCVETVVGFWTTLFHELRHQQILNSLHYPILADAGDDIGEEQVESWATETYADFQKKQYLF